MSWLRVMIFRQERETPKRPRDGKWSIIALVLLIAIFVGLLGASGILAAIWDMLCDIAAAIGDFIKYIVGLRQ